MHVINVIKEVSDGVDQERDWEEIKGFAIHRCGVDLKYDHVLGYDAISVCAAFTGKDPKWKEVAKATGGQIAYTIMVGGNLGPKRYDGLVWQCLPLDEIGHHARAFSRGYVGIGVIADPRIKEISRRQWDSLVEILVELCVGFGFDPYKTIKGHGEIEGSHDGSKAPGKPNACPGDLLNMNVLRDDVATLIKDGARRRLYDAGLEFE